MSTRTSKASSMRATTTSPIDVVRALLADDFPGWGREPLHSVLSTRLDITPRAARELLAQVRVSTRVPFAMLGRLDETWLFRIDAAAPVVDLARAVEGVAEAHEFEAPYAIVRTCAEGAVDRERLLRALHAKLGERPLAQLARPSAPSPKPSLKPAREDWALVAALRRNPWGEAEGLAREAKVAPRGAKERLARLATERVIALDAAPVSAPLARVLVRTSPTSTAAARRAFDAIPDIVQVWLPSQGEVAFADALVIGTPALDAARDVPGIASVELLPPRATWENDALIDQLLRRAG